MKGHWFCELPLASASGLKGRMQIGFSQIILFYSENILKIFPI